jgi:hypothetical protein
MCNVDVGVRETSIYSVKDVYKNLMTGLIVSSNPSLARAWHKSIPSKVACLAWRLFQNRIPTKDNLFRRGIIGHGSLKCVGYCGVEESVSHLFCECPVILQVFVMLSVSG